MNMFGPKLEPGEKVVMRWPSAGRQWTWAGLWLVSPFLVLGLVLLFVPFSAHVAQFVVPLAVLAGLGFGIAQFSPGSIVNPRVPRGALAFRSVAAGGHRPAAHGPLERNARAPRKISWRRVKPFDTWSRGAGRPGCCVSVGRSSSALSWRRRFSTGWSASRSGLLCC